MNRLSINENDYYLIEAFFDRTLDESDLKLFEKKLKEEEFAQQVALYEHAKDTIINLYNPSKKIEENNFKARLNVLKAGPYALYFEKRTWLLGIAVTVSLFLFVGVYTLTTLPTVDVLALAESKALEVNTDEITDLGNRSTEKEKEVSTKEDLLKTFHTAKYEEMLVIINQFSEEQQESLLLLKGIAHRKLNQIEEAVFCFNQIRAQRDIALWNLVALYLEQQPKDKNKARYYLNQIIQEDFNSKGDAKRILDGL